MPDGPGRIFVRSFRDVRSVDDVASYVAGLALNWPQRREVVRHICRQVSQVPYTAPHVVELGSGSGILAEALLTEMPELTYTGVDNSEPLQAVARKELASFGARARLIRADLNADDWPTFDYGSVHAVVSMQSLHDLGDESRVYRIYELAKGLLTPAGLFLNADLVLPSDLPNPNHPGRCSVARHLQILEAQGYVNVSCSLELGEFGCCVGYVAT